MAVRSKGGIAKRLDTIEKIPDPEAQAEMAFCLNLEVMAAVTDQMIAIGRAVLKLRDLGARPPVLSVDEEGRLEVESGWIGKQHWVYKTAAGDLPADYFKEGFYGDL